MPGVKQFKAVKLFVSALCAILQQLSKQSLESSEVYIFSLISRLFPVVLARVDSSHLTRHERRMEDGLFQRASCLGSALWGLSQCIKHGGNCCLRGCHIRNLTRCHLAVVWSSLAENHKAASALDKSPPAPKWVAQRVWDKTQLSLALGRMRSFAL